MLFLLYLFSTPHSASVSYSPPVALAQTTTVARSETVQPASKVALVPFYSQFKNISSSKWQKVGCGITDLAMIIDYYGPAPASVDKLLSEGIALGAYDNNAGWSYSGLISVAKKYGLTGTWYNVAGSGKTASLSKIEKAVADGPVIASVHYKFEPTNPIPHLVVITGIKDGYVYYNDPAAKTGNGKITTDTFYKAWKGRYIVIRPKIDSVA